MSRVVALLGLREMSDLSPQSAPKRTLSTLLSPIAIYEYTPLERSSPPVLLRLALHCCASRVLHFEPIRRTPRPVSRILPFRYDAFEAHLASMGKDGRTVALDMLVEPGR